MSKAVHDCVIAYEDSGLSGGSESSKSEEGRGEHDCLFFNEVKERQEKREWEGVLERKDDDEGLKRRGSWQGEWAQTQALFEQSGVQIRAFTRPRYAPHARMSGSLLVLGSSLFQSLSEVFCHCLIYRVS